MVLGAPNNDGNGSNSGHVRVYEWNGSVWNQLGTDIDGEAAIDRSGYALSLSGGVLTIGAYQNDGNGSNSGHVRAYRLHETIAITEWLADVNGDENTDEWVELYNYGSSDIDLQNWRIKDEGADDDVIVTTSFVVPAGGYVILAKNKIAFEAQWIGSCPNPNVIEVPGITLVNGTDEIIIEDDNGDVVWSVAYTSDATEGQATYYADGSVFTYRLWGSAASPGIDRDDLDPTSGTVGYQGNNHTTDPFALTSGTGDVGSPMQGNLGIVPVDITRGDALDFDGINDYVNTGSVLLPTSGTQVFTISTWFK